MAVLDLSEMRLSMVRWESSQTPRYFRLSNNGTLSPATLIDVVWTLLYFCLLEKMMTSSVRHVLLHSIEDYTEVPRTEWVRNHPGMCVLNGSQVHWTEHVETHIKEKGAAGVKEYFHFLEN